jgi:hypothetical protein
MVLPVEGAAKLLGLLPSPEWVVGCWLKKPRMLENTRKPRMSGGGFTENAEKLGNTAKAQKVMQPASKGFRPA